jgi:hypothetical protein
MVKGFNTAIKPTKSRYIGMALLVLLVAFAMLFSVGVASGFADTGNKSTDEARAQQELHSYVQSQVSKKKYEVEGGGYMYGVDVMSGGSDAVPDVSETQFSKLSKKGQQSFTADLMKAMDQAATSDQKQQAVQKTPDVTEQTTQNWLKELQTHPGMGSRILQQTLGQTKPDFVSANAIYKPFSGMVGTLIALIAVIMMAMLALTLAVDLAYITVPPARGLVKDDKSRLVSHEAISAVKAAEDGDGKGVALGYYLKKRFISILVLAFCLVLLIQGEIFNFVGTMVDLTFGLVNVFVQS